jgi:hypothetical protein
MKKHWFSLRKPWRQLRIICARAEYVMAESYHIGSETQVTAEYEALMAKEPGNPLYPAALVMGQRFASAEAKHAWLEKVAALAPEWAWGHYAKAKLAEPKQPKTALSESLKATDALGRL